MRRIIASEFISADGYVSGPANDMSWVRNNFSEEFGTYAAGLMDSTDTILLGRVTYQIMAGAWPNLTEQQSPGAEKMNGTPKVVLSRTLDKAPWGKYAPATIIKDDVAHKLSELKAKAGKNIVIYGSPNMVQSLTNMGLIDEYQLLVYPIFLGSGKLLFSGLDKPAPLALLRTQSFNNGVQVRHYAPRPASQQ